MPGANTVAPVTGGGNGHLRIGGDVDPGSCMSFFGAIDEVYIYGRALNATESKQLFDAR